MQAALTALFEMIKQFLSVKQTGMEHQPTLQLIDSVDHYPEYLTKKDLSKYNSLKKKFNKNN